MKSDAHDPLPLSNQKPIDEDIRLEIAQHIELRTEELISEGMPPEAARAEALRSFGSVDEVSRECREIARLLGVNGGIVTAAMQRLVREGRVFQRVDGWRVR